MTILRTVCPTCDIIRVRAPEVTLRHCDGADHVEVAFRCPGCAGRVVQELSVSMVPMLLSAGVMVADQPVIANHPSNPSFSAHPSQPSLGDDGGITEAEIQAFIADLDRPDWADELAY